MENVDGDLVPGVFSIGENPVCGAFWEWWTWADIFTGAVLCRG
jgi:hypothetical protein